MHQSSVVQGVKLSSLASILVGSLMLVQPLHAQQIVEDDTTLGSSVKIPAVPTTGASICFYNSKFPGNQVCVEPKGTTGHVVLFEVKASGVAATISDIEGCTIGKNFAYQVSAQSASVEVKIVEDTLAPQKEVFKQTFLITGANTSTSDAFGVCFKAPNL